MLPYWLMFGLWTAGALQAERRRAQDSRILFFAAAAIVTALMIGLRFQVGGDWSSYQRMYDEIYFLPLSLALATTDPGYAAVNWVGAQADLGVLFTNLICAGLFMGGLARLAWRQPNPALAILVAVPYLIIVVAMGYTRQAAAIGIICFVLADASERHLFRLGLIIGVAALFHKTAILMLPIALIPVFRRNILFGVAGTSIFVILFVLLLRSTSDELVTNYVQSDYNSQGAGIRVAMNVLAAFFFLLFRSRMDFSPFQKSFWTTCSILAILSVGALLVSSASSGIDRLSLYLIPLQAVTYCRLPYIIRKDKAALFSGLFGVIAYSFAIQFVWLNYAENAISWLPYRLFL